MLSSRRKAYVLLLFGIALLINPFAPGLHVGESSVHQYEPVTVSYNESEGLQVADPETGRELSLRSVDDDIICTGPATRRLCKFEYAVYGGLNVSTPEPGFGGSPDYRYVYANDTLYEPAKVERGGEWWMSLDRVTESDPLENVAKGGQPSEAAQSAISTGSILMYHELPEDDTIVRYDGQYYAFYETGMKQYEGDGGSFCSAGGDGFCSAADAKRWTDSLLTLGSWSIGAVLIVFAFRSRDLT